MKDYPYMPGWRQNKEGNKPAPKHSVLMLTKHGIAEGERDGEEWLQYRWSAKVKDSDVLHWLHLDDLMQLEKEGDPLQQEQPEADLEKAIEGLCANWSEDEEYGLQNINTSTCVTLEEVKEAMRCTFELGKNSKDIISPIDSPRKKRNTKSNPKPGEKFWVRCKTEKSENLWFDKGDERPAHAIQGKDGMLYAVCLNKDGTGNCVYQYKDRFLKTFEIIENRGKKFMSK